jgi:hypothetical protein
VQVEYDRVDRRLRERDPARDGDRSRESARRRESGGKMRDRKTHRLGDQAVSVFRFYDAEATAALSIYKED